MCSNFHHSVPAKQTQTVQTFQHLGVLLSLREDLQLQPEPEVSHEKCSQQKSVQVDLQQLWPPAWRMSVCGEQDGSPDCGLSSLWEGSHLQEPPVTLTLPQAEHSQALHLPGVFPDLHPRLQSEETRLAAHWQQAVPL